MSKTCLAVLALVSLQGFGASRAEPSQTEIDQIIVKFAENEAAFARARENYTYRQSAKLQESDSSGVPGGKYELVSDIVFGPDNKRTERIVRAPMTTLQMIQMSPEDEQDLRNVLPFVLTSDTVNNYHVRYLGHEKIDEIAAYVFAVKPKTMEPGKRYFVGQIWVDDRDLMIVKSYGRSSGILKKGTDQQFPKFETYREQIDGKYWFPTYTIANSTLHFKDNDVRVRMSVKYEDYKQFKSDTKITFGDEVTQPETPKKP